MFSTFDCTIRARETILSHVGGGIMPARPISGKWPAFRDFFVRKHDFFLFPLKIAKLCAAEQEPIALHRVGLGPYQFFYALIYYNYKGLSICD